MSNQDRVHYFESEMNMPGKMVVLPLRCTVVKTASGVVIISPVDFRPDEIHKIKLLGEVTEIVAPSLIHHLHVRKAAGNFPGAKVWGVPGAPEKLPEIKFAKIFTRDPWPHAPELEAEFVAGVPKLNEVLFFDRPSRTLIATDFVFNLTHPKGWASPIMLRLLGTYGKFAVSKLMNKFMEDLPAFNSSVKKVMNWDFDRIAMGHGDLVNTGGKARLQEALRHRGFEA